MLAKQVWHLIQDTDPLFYKVFTSKYFPNCSIFEAASSFGSWRVGDGKTIWIFQDAWLLNSIDGRIIPSPVTLAPKVTADTIIDPHIDWWNTYLIDLCFYLPEAQYIKSLPFCSTPQSDILIWPNEKLGYYSVKSGYKALTKLSLLDSVRTEQSEAQKTFWRSIWKLKVSGKIKHFMWNSCTNSLPTKENLLKHTILQESVCQIYDKELESVLHALWRCEKVQRVWSFEFSWVDKSKALSVSFSDLFYLVQERQ